MAQQPSSDMDKLVALAQSLGDQTLKDLMGKFLQPLQHSQVGGRLLLAVGMGTVVTSRLPSQVREKSQVDSKMARGLAMRMLLGNSEARKAIHDLRSSGSMSGARVVSAAAHCCSAPRRWSFFRVRLTLHVCICGVCVQAPAPQASAQAQEAFHLYFHCSRCKLDQSSCQYV
jgi:hypothetical protein